MLLLFGSFAPRDSNKLRKSADSSLTAPSDRLFKGRHDWYPSASASGSARWFGERGALVTGEGFHE
jgi:hypothetical protein